MESSSPASSKLKLQSALGQLAYNHVKEQLLEGDLKPQDSLSVVALAEQLGCSRVPVMEALKRLEQEGFLTIVPQVGCKVVSPEAQDVMDFFELFSSVEGTIARFAAERRSDEDLVDFRKVCRHIEKEAALAGTPADRDPVYRQLNLLFYTQMHKMARAPLASCIVAGFWDRSDFYIKTTFGSLYFSSEVKRVHGGVRDAIIDGDAEMAESEIKAHLRAVGQNVARRLQELESSGS